MRNSLFFFIISIAIFITGCSKSDDGNGYDPYRQISLRPANGVLLKSGGELLTAQQIVEQAWEVQLEYGGYVGQRGFSEAQRDLVNYRLMLGSTDIIRYGNELVPDFIEGKNFVLLRYHPETRSKDTIAYIPNSVMRRAEKLIKDAFNRNDYATCYAVMDSSFKFYPINGKLYRELKSKGLN